MTAPVLHHADILAPGRMAHLARAVLTPARPKALHGHDFHELLWVQNGRIRHHLPEGGTDLTEGDLVFLAPGDTHALQGRREEPLVASLTLHPEVVAALPDRHPQFARRLFWGGTPVTVTLDSHRLAALNRAANALDAGPASALEVEAFLLPLCAALLPPDDVPADAPDWLRSACDAARDPATFRDGAAGLVAATGRAHPHVARTMRRLMDVTPSDFVNAQRMRWAASRLTGTTDPLAEIAAECGIPNLSHFHKLFRTAHGTTPLAYRRARQRDVLQP